MDLILNASQKLLMSQKMIQSAEILQMSSLELIDYVNELSVENPIFDYEENIEEDEFELIRKKLQYLSDHEKPVDDYRSEDKDNTDWNFGESSKETLSAYLLEQASTLPQLNDTYGVIKYIILNIDKSGYLKETIEEIAKTLNIDISEAKKALDIVQGFEPLGVGARDLKECLLIQLKSLYSDITIAQKIVENHLERVGKNQIHIIAKSLKISQDEAYKAVQLIKKLNPKPGNSFNDLTTLEFIVPDVIIHKSQDDYEIILNNKFFPNISINPYYKNIMDANDNSQTREYISNKIKQAQWIMTCINKRNSTLTKTIEAIVSIQKEFFEHGCSHIKPLKLEDIGKIIHVHESTVSRTIRQKYLQCCHGVFPLSYFFQSNVLSNEKNGSTSTCIKNIIRNIIKNEDISSPLSDREISEELKKSDICISRRTVTKYREAMEIPGISGRKVKP